MKEEREKLLDVLMKHHLASGCVKASTPRVQSMKRSLDKTPTPKGKSKKALFKTPEKLQKNPDQHLKLPNNMSKEDKTTQTCVPEDFDVKILVKIAGVDASKIVREESIKAAIKSLFNNRSPHAVLKNFCKDAKYREALFKLCVTELKKEIDSVVSNKSDVLKCRNSENLINFDWSVVESNLKQDSPNLFLIMSNLMDSEKKQNLPVLITSLAVLFYGRSRSVNQLQYTLGLTLDKCGLSKEGLKILHDLGITVASSTINKEKKHLIKEQEKKLSATMSREYFSYSTMKAALQTRVPSTN